MSQDSGPAAAMPEIVIDRTATPDRRIMIVDSFGQRVQMSIDHSRKLAAEGVSKCFRRSRTSERPGPTQACRSTWQRPGLQSGCNSLSSGPVQRDTRVQPDLWPERR